MVLTLAGSLSIATSDGYWEPPPEWLVSRAIPVQEALQATNPNQPAWMQQALSIIKEFEGLELADYIDVAGIATLV